jgi:predicted nucleic acid-binding protein
MALVVDASVAAKWLIEEDGSDAALALLERDEPLIAPSLILLEVASVLWKRCRAGGISAAEGRSALAALEGYFAELVPDQDLVGSAFTIALDLDHPIYDCLYVALAAARDCRLVTADARLLGRLVKSPHRDRVMPLGDWPG